MLPFPFLPARRLKESRAGGLGWLLGEGDDREGNGRPVTPAPKALGL